MRRLPAAQLAPGEALHGRRRRAARRPADGHLRHRGHRPDRPGARSSSASCSRPSSRSSCRSRCSSSRCSTSGSRSSGGCAPASRRSRADRKHLHHRLLDMGHSHLHAVLIFYGWTAVASVGCLLTFVFPVYFGIASSWAFLILGIGFVICAALTLAPLGRRKRRPSPPRPSGDRSLRARARRALEAAATAARPPEPPVDAGRAPDRSPMTAAPPDRADRTPTSNPVLRPGPALGRRARRRHRRRRRRSSASWSPASEGLVSALSARSWPWCSWASPPASILSRTASPQRPLRRRVLRHRARRLAPEVHALHRARRRAARRRLAEPDGALPQPSSPA